MKQEYAKPIAKMVKFHFDERIMASSGGVGTLYSLYKLEYCQQAQETTCSYFYKNPALCSAEPHDQGIDGPTI